MLHPLLYLSLVLGIPFAALICWMKWFAHQRGLQSRRPFDQMPRPAGWSLQNRLTDLMDDFTMDFMAGGVAGLMSFALFLSGKFSPFFIFPLGFITCALFFYRSAKKIENCANHRLGLVGEQVVGQILDQLSSDTVHVFHDMEIKEPGKKAWNIDHVVVTSAGVFAIETKTRRKPRSTSPEGQQSHQVVFDGQQLNFPHPMGFDRKGLEQAQGNSTWLSEKLTALNGCPIAVSPVLVFPGWWVERKGKSCVSVVNAKELPGFFKNRKPILIPGHQRAIKAQLEERCMIDLTR